MFVSVRVHLSAYRVYGFRSGTGAGVLLGIVKLYTSLGSALVTTGPDKELSQHIWSNIYIQTHNFYFFNYTLRIYIYIYIQPGNELGKRNFIQRTAHALNTNENWKNLKIPGARINGRVRQTYEFRTVAIWPTDVRGIAIHFNYIALGESRADVYRHSDVLLSAHDKRAIGR